MAEQATTEPEIRKGLAGVPVDYTAISKVDPESNSLLYRGYPPVQDLAKPSRSKRSPTCCGTASFPTTASSPTSSSSSVRTVPSTTSSRRSSTSCPLTVHPMDVIRTAASVIGARDPRGRG